MSTTTWQRLRNVAAALRCDPVTVGSVTHAQGPAGVNTLLVVLGALCLSPVPGVGTLLGVGVMAIAIGMWHSRAALAMPRRLADFELSRSAAKPTLVALVRLDALADRLGRARLPVCANFLGARWSAALVGLMGFTIALPIPLGNFLPAVALICIGLASPRHDGLVLVLGSFVALLGIVWPLALVVGAWHLV